MIKKIEVFLRKQLMRVLGICSVTLAIQNPNKALYEKCSANMHAGKPLLTINRLGDEQTIYRL